MDVRGDLQALDLKELEGILKSNNAFFEGNPYLKVDLLQINDTGTNVVTIKDEDLNANYDNGQELSIDCIASPWNMNNMSGVSFKVYKGETRKLDLKPQKKVA